MFREIIPYILMLAAVIALIILFFKEAKIVKLETPLRECIRRAFSRMLRRLRITIAKRLRRSERFMNWLNEPSISEQIEKECNIISINVARNWRNNECKAYCRSFYI